MFSIASTLISIIAVSSIMMSIEPWVVVVFAVIVVFKTIIIVNSKKQQYKNWKLDQELQKELNYHLNLLFDDECAQEMRMSGLAGWIIGKYRSVSKKAKAIENNSTKEITKNRLVEEVLTQSQNVVLYSFVAYKVLSKGMLLSELTVILTGIQQIEMNTVELIRNVLELIENAVYLESYIKFLQIENVIAVDRSDDINIDWDKASDGKIVFSGVSFRYPGAQEPALKDVDLSLDLGKFYMVVGENGAGKTTLVKLICRLYDPYEGSISVSGDDIRDINYRSYRSGIGVVFQDYKVYEYSVGENIALDKWDENSPPVDRINEVLSLLHLKEKVDRMSKGIFTPLGRSFSPDGISLSGGETQKIAMAKALFNNREILILDEPSSALDPIAEKELIDSMLSAGKGKTIFYISHRLSTAKFADKIIYLSGDTVKAVGTHEELMKTSPEYAKLYHAQADNYV